MSDNPMFLYAGEYESVELPWRAERSAKSAYFGRTGIPAAP